MNLSELPQDLPVPIDDGAAGHLPGTLLPTTAFTNTRGRRMDFRAVSGILVIYVYPMTGRPGVPLPDGWDDIPGG